MNKDTNKIPVPPIKAPLYLPVTFWAELLAVLDKKVQSISELSGSGKISFEIVISRGVVSNVYFEDKVLAQELARKARES
jgi:hypothetical protein